MKRTMQRRNALPVEDSWQRRILWVATRFATEVAWHRDAHEQRDGSRGPTGVWSMARVDSAAVKVGKVSRVAEALPHSEGAAYKQQCCEIVACSRD